MLLDLLVLLMESDFSWSEGDINQPSVTTSCLLLVVYSLEQARISLA